MRISMTSMPIQDALAEAASSIPLCDGEKARIKEAVGRFKDKAGEALNEAIAAHAKNCRGGSYDSQEEIRVLGNMCVAMYLADCVDRMFPIVMEKGDAGTASLFNIALAHVSGFMDGDFFQFTPGQILTGLKGFHPILSSSLSRCGLDALVWGRGGMPDLSKMYMQYIDEVNRRSEEVLSRLKQPI